MLSAVDPRTHPCDLNDLDYSHVKTGFICCQVCSRQWKTRPYWPSGEVWINSCPVRMPVEHIDWLAGHEPYPEPTQEEILADRSSRLEQLDKIQAERMEMFQDTGAGLDWLSKKRGSGGKVDFEFWNERLRDNPEGQREERRRDITLSFHGEASDLLDIVRALVKMWS